MNRMERPFSYEYYGFDKQFPAIPLANAEPATKELIEQWQLEQRKAAIKSKFQLPKR